MGKLKIGMYGRLYSGDIVKILEVYDKVEPIHYKTDINKAVRTWERDFVLWGYKKIDVIKEGDYVNGREVLVIDDDYGLICADGKMYKEKDIKTLLTEELYKKNMKVFGD